MNQVVPRSSFQCDEPVRPCGCPPGHQCWHCQKDIIAEKLAWLLLNHPDLVEILNATRMGVTNGVPALPGEVGEWISGSQTINIPALISSQVYNTSARPLQLPPGDWMVFADAVWDEFYPSAAFGSSPVLPGMAGPIQGGLWGTSNPYARIAIGQPAHALLTNPGVLNFAVQLTAGVSALAGTFTMRAQAYRIR